MITVYLSEQGVEPSPALATALTYAIYADAKGYATKFSRVDRTALTWLSHFFDPGLMNQIENAVLPKSYYEDLLLALQSCFIYSEVAICFLPSAVGPEVVGEVADLIVRCEGVHRVLCGGMVGERMVFSARTTKQGGSAAELLRKTLGRQNGGSWGGHRHRAGGYINVALSDSGKADLEAKVRQGWLLASGVEKQRGVRLVARKEILKAL
jgi:nanoRNase/pAp phosphatase (c-di-AMP/oligoRNAs hydrolase)